MSIPPPPEGDQPMKLPDMLADRITAALSSADPAAVARTDQLSGLWRDFFAQRQLNLADPMVADAALRTLTMVYGLLMAGHASGEIDEDAWQRINDVIASGATAVTIVRRHSQ